MDVIVIDDEEGMREGMRRVLEKKGFSVDTAEDGSVAMELLEIKSYDLALVDLKMPRVDGFKVTDYIREKYGQKMVVVIVSALATVEAAVEITRRGAFDFLVKPFTPQDLLRVVERASGQCRLIQEREKYLVELNSERNLSRQLINSMEEGVIVLNLNKKPVLMNPRAEFLLGVRYRQDLDVEDLAFERGVLEAIDRLLSGAEAANAILLSEQRRAEWVLQIRISPYIRDREMGGVMLILSDVTEQWKAEHDKNRFISLVAHELKSPLAAIINYINVIQTGMLDDKIDKIHEILGRSKIRAEALIDLVSDLQYLNKREAGKVEKSIELIDLKKVIGEQLDFLSIQAERMKVAMSLVAGNEDYVVMADRGDMDRIFMNLITNGIKYNREGGKLEIRLGTEEGGLQIVVTISDTGMGMSDREMENLFQEFYRVKNSETNGIPGTGLGLATVKRVLASYNGQITCRSTPAVGTVFTVVFPRQAG